jgi:MFS family permease
MCEPIAEEVAKTVVARTHPGDGVLDSFPLLRTGPAKVLISRSRAARFLVSSSPAFRLLMVGSSISMLGTRISTVAFPMLVLHLNHSPLVTGLVGFAAIAPSMLVYIPAGVLVDRWNPRRVMLASEFLRGLTIASVVIALTMFKRVDIWFLIIAMVIEEVLEIFSMLADRRYLSRVTEREKIESRQASIEVRAHAVVLAGRPIGPFLFVIKPFLPFLADAVSFLASVASLLLLRRIDEPQREVPRLPKKVIRDIRQGFGWLKRDPRACLTVFLMAMTSLVAQALLLMFLVLAHSKQLSTVAIGVVLAASGAGGAAGSFCARTVLAALAAMRGFWMSLQMIVWSMALASLALAGGQSAYLCAVAMFILGFTGAIGNVEFGAYIVRNVRDSMIATVTGIGQMLAIGACAVGPVLGGVTIQHFQVQGAISILFAIVVALAFASFLMPEAPGQRRPDLDIIGPAITPVLAPAGANQVVAGVTLAKASGARPGPKRDNGFTFIQPSEAISLPGANSRPWSMIYHEVLTCTNAKKRSIMRARTSHRLRCRDRIREESGGFRRHWNLLARQA